AKFYHQKYDIENEAMAYAGAAHYFYKSMQCSYELNSNFNDVISSAWVNEDLFFDIYSTLFAPLALSHTNESDRYQATEWRRIVLDLAPRELELQKSEDRVKSLQEITLTFLANKYFNTINEIATAPIPKELKSQLFQVRGDYKIRFDDRYTN